MRLIIVLVIGWFLSDAAWAEDVLGLLSKTMEQMSGTAGQQEITDLEKILRGATPGAKSGPGAAKPGANNACTTPQEQQKSVNSYICIQRQNEEKICRDHTGKLTRIPLQAKEEKNHDFAH